MTGFPAAWRHQISRSRGILRAASACSEKIQGTVWAQSPNSPRMARRSAVGKRAKLCKVSSLRTAVIRGHHHMRHSGLTPAIFRFAATGVLGGLGAAPYPARL